MKKSLITVCVALIGTTSFAAPINNKSSQQDQLGYSYGYVMGRTNAETLKDINLDAFIQGIKEGFSGQKATLTDEEMAKALAQYKQQSEAKQMLEFKKTADENAQLGSAFLTENAKKSSVITRPSGLQYTIIQQGTGKSPSAKSKVSVNYEGRLIDGTVFDSSIARNEPIEFQVSQVIPGWTEGLQLMKEGAKYRFFIPAKLAYGEIGAGDAIAPNSTLIFDVELLKVLP